MSTDAYSDAYPDGIIKPVLSGLLDGATSLITTYPWWFIAVIGIAIILLAGRMLLSKMRTRDPQRAFTKSERKAGFTRAGNRCELEGFLWFRCGSKAEHGDHHYPWSRGGATEMINFVAACAKCNMSKGAKVASRFATWRLERRRRGYFPNGVEVTAGSKYKIPTKTR